VRMKRFGAVAALAAVVLSAGCGASETRTGSSGSPTTSPTTATTRSPATGTPRTTAKNTTKVIRVQVRGKTVTPKPARIAVTLGWRVRIVVTGDKADVVHVHAYDKEATFTLGKPASIEFTATIPGLFEVEAHESGLVLFSLLVR